MLSIKKIKLNQRGFGHHIIMPLLVIAAVTAIGAYVINKSHAESPSDATTAATNQPRIAFTSRLLGSNQPIGKIYTVSPNGTGLKQIPNSGANNIWVAWSHDHKQLAWTYQTQVGSSQGMSTGGPDGYPFTGLAVPLNATYYPPAWTPDDSGLVYSSALGTTGKYNLYKTQISNSKITPITTIFDKVNAGDNSSQVSPDGSRVLFEDTKTATLYTVGTNGKSLSGHGKMGLDKNGNGCWLTNLDVGSMSQHNLSPDGKKFVLPCYKDGKASLNIYNVSDGYVTLPSKTIPVPETNIESVAWSPDTTQDTFVFSGEWYDAANKADKKYVATTKVIPSGTIVHTTVAQLPDTQKFVPSIDADWSPSGDKIIYVNSTSKNSSTSINTVNPDGTGNTLVYQGAVNYWVYAAWRP